MTQKPFTFPIEGVVPDQYAQVSVFTDSVNRALGIAGSMTRYRPGEQIDAYGSTLAGERNGAPPPGLILTRAASGRVLAVTGAGIVAYRDRIALNDRPVIVFGRYQRTTDPTDPSGDTVRLRVQWLDHALGQLSQSDVDSRTLYVADGVIQAFGIIGGPAATLTPPAGARYAVVYIQTFGTDGVTDILALGAIQVPELADRALVADLAVESEINAIGASGTWYPVFSPSTAPATEPLSVTSAVSWDAETSTLALPNLVADFIDLPPTFVWPQENIPEFPVARTFYVTADGDDSNSGTSLSKPLATITAAIAKAATISPQSSVIIVHPGTYTVPPNTVLPANTAIYGYDLRTVVFRLPTGQEENNMFLLCSGTKIRGVTFTNLRHEAPPDYPDTTTGLGASQMWDYFTTGGGANLWRVRPDNSGNPAVFPVTLHGYRPKKGYAVAFKPGEIITRSPYISECTGLHNLTQEQMFLPINRAAGNPEVPRGMGLLYADGSVLDPNSPLRSMVIDSFTAVNPNGCAYVVDRNAIVQLVSCFTNWSRVGVWCHDGGQVSLVNSNTTFGDYSFVSTGFRYAIRVPDTQSDLGTYPAAAATLAANTTAIINHLMGTLANNYNDGAFATALNVYGWNTTWTMQQKEFTQRDTLTLLRFLGYDFKGGVSSGCQAFVKGLFNWNAEYVFNPTLLPAFLVSFDVIANAIKNPSVGGITAAGPQAMLDSLIAMIKDVLDNRLNYRVVFGSLLEASNQQFANAGTGVNYNALPYWQRGTGQSVDPATTIIEADGGRVYATFSTEAGDTYLGRDIRVDFERSTIEGQAFARGVLANVLPVFLALGR